MSIGFDGKRAVRNNTGLGNYSRLMVEVLAKRFPEHEYILYAPEFSQNPRLEQVLKLPNVSVRTPDTTFWKAAPSLWRTKGVSSQLLRDGIDLAHGLSGELPLDIASLPIPGVVTIHDLIFRRFPKCYNPIDRTIYDYKFKQAARNSTRIIAISECTKRDVMEFYNIDPDKIDVVYQGCHSQFKRTPSDSKVAQVKMKYGLDRPYIISVGTIEQRKNQILPVRGIRGLPEELDLVLVGRRTSYARVLDQYIRQYNMGNRVKFIEHADFSDLPALYAGAFCSTYPSHYEGFGIPVIESLSVGTPVVVATGSCLEEAGGPDVPAVNPYDVEEWLATIKEMIEFPASARNIAEKGQEYVKRFSDLNMAEGTMESYTKAMSN